MAKTQKKNFSHDHIRSLSIVDLILIDHRFLKECIDVLGDENADKRKKMNMAMDFFDALSTHSNAEKKAVYGPLEKNEEFHFRILEAEIEHGLIDQNIRNLKAKLTNVRVLKDELEAELKVLADHVKHHLMEEESHLLPTMSEHLDEVTLKSLGQSFMKLRKFTAKDLKDYPLLQDELIQWKDSVQKVSSEFLTKMEHFVENLQH